MGKLVHNERLHYNVYATASLWWNALTEWRARKVNGEEVDIIIGVNGIPLIIPNGVALYSGEWYVDVDRVIYGIRELNKKYDVTVKPIGSPDRYMTSGHMERYIHDMTVKGNGIVQKYRTQNLDGSQQLAYIDTNGEPVFIHARSPRKYDSAHSVRECLIARFEYDIVHNTQYLIDNFGDPADRHGCENVLDYNHNEDKDDKDDGELMSKIDEQIRHAEADMRIDDLIILARWLDVMGEWAESNEYGHRMHVVVNGHGEPHCTDAPGDDDICWESLVAANMDWSEALDGYQDDPNSRWYVLDDDGVQCNMWGLASADEMRNALRMAIVDRYANW